MPYKSLNLQNINTYPLSERKNIVTLGDLIYPDQSSTEFESKSLRKIADAIVEARSQDRQVILMMGAHVIKSGLGPVLIELLKKGWVTHIAGNGAVAVHDFELAMIGETSEDVATSIEDGTFGMVDETGRFTHKALRDGVFDGLGYGESLGRFISEYKFAHRDISILYKAYELGIPVTIHTTIGADIIHQHPDCDFGILGTASGQDFKIFCQSVSDLKSGVFLNFGSAVTGPEVFLKSLSITRNLGYAVDEFTTGNFDLFPLAPDYHKPLSKENPEYYYRPRKNIINRPTTMGGQGYHIQGDHRETIPTLFKLLSQKSGAQLQNKDSRSSDYKTNSLEFQLERVAERSERAANSIGSLLKRKPELRSAIPALCRAYLIIAQGFENGRCLFLYGNGGSMADAQHISGELLKSFSGKRILPERTKKRLAKFDQQAKLIPSLEPGLPTFVLGLNPTLSTAIDNDFKERWLNIAQELQALAKPGDVFMGISTSGTAQNILYASQTARALGITTILLTGETNTTLSSLVDIAIHAPGKRTERIQEVHISLYHCLCEMLEEDFFAKITEEDHGIMRYTDLVQ